MSVPVMSGIRSDSFGEAALILGPSLGTSSALWDQAVPLLRERFAVLSVDLPGHGRSPAATEPFTVGELADAVIATADAAGIGQFAYAGVSLGGQIGLELALRHPDRVRAIAVICSAAHIGAEGPWRERASKVRQQGTASMVAGSAERWFAPGFLDREPDFGGALLNSLVETDDHSYALCCEALAVSDLRPRLAEIAAPTLVLYGDGDAVIPAEDARAVAAGVQHGRALAVERAAHLAPAERPAESSAALIEFLERGADDAR